MRKRIINQSNDTVICRGHRNKYSTHVEATKKCIGYCPYAYSKRGEHWTQDELECECPISHEISPKDKFRVRKSHIIEQVRHKGKRIFPVKRSKTTEGNKKE